jgi:hypothetical protein
MSTKFSIVAGLCIAIAAIPLGAVLWFVGLGIGLGAGSSLNPDDNWLVPFGTAAAFGGPLIAIAGVVALVTLAILALVRKK